MTEFTKAPGWDWVVEYEDADGQLESMMVFACIRIDDAILEARRSLSFGEERIPGFVAPAVVAARRVLP